MEQNRGKIFWVSGPAVKASGLTGVKMHTIVYVGEKELLGEIVEIDGDEATIQVYEDTIGLKGDEEVIATGKPLTVELGPGLLGKVFDGIQRPLEDMQKTVGDFIKKGIHLNALDRKKKWDFKATASKGEEVIEGDIIGVVSEGEGLEHRVMVPKGISGIIQRVAEGPITLDEPVAILDNSAEIKMYHEWPARISRPYKEKLPPSTPFITGQRVIDTFFHIAKGGTAIIPGGFGTGKTVTEQTLAKYAEADIIVYVGCGERGNEMSELLNEFSSLTDPNTGKSLLSRTIIIANTSNMPVAAREASIYTGITIAEYFRDMGYHVAMFADSTSRWAEALREMSSRMEEMPGEEGYPPYMALKMGSFYERAGSVVTIGSKEREGAITIVGAVSPPGGDFSEPVTQASLRYGGALWSLDTALAYGRHFPAINWINSYTLFTNQLKEWYLTNISHDWAELRENALNLLSKEDDLKEIVQLIGYDALQDKDRLVLETGRLMREGFLRQNAFSSVDAFCTLKKQRVLLKTIMRFYEASLDALDNGKFIDDILREPVVEKILRLRETAESEMESKARYLQQEIDDRIK